MKKEDLNNMRKSLYKLYDAHIIAIRKLIESAKRVPREHLTKEYLVSLNNELVLLNKNATNIGKDINGLTFQILKG